jgi:acyl-CoA dehydrogenase
MDRLVLPHHRQWHDLAERGEHPTQLIDDLKALAKRGGPVEPVPAGLRPDEPGTRLSTWSTRRWPR